MRCWTTNRCRFVWCCYPYITLVVVAFTSCFGILHLTVSHMLVPVCKSKSRSEILLYKRNNVAVPLKFLMNMVCFMQCHSTATELLTTYQLLLKQLHYSTLKCISQPPSYGVLFIIKHLRVFYVVSRCLLAFFGDFGLLRDNMLKF